MRKRDVKKSVLALVLCGILIICTGCGERIGNSSLNKVTDKTCEYLVKEVPEAVTGERGDDWVVFAVKRSGTDAAGNKYYDSYYDNVRGNVKSKNGRLSEGGYTAYARVSLTLWAIGRDPKHVEGHDLMSNMDNYRKVAGQGINAEIFALISAGCGNCKLKNEKRYLEDIMADQLQNGGVSFDGKTADVDITAMAIQALAYYYDRGGRYKKAADSALNYLSDKQKNDGSYGNAESTAQVIIAIASLKRDPLTAKDFTKAGHDLGDGLMEYWMNGAFCHVKGDGADTLATEQALCALDSVRLAGEGKRLYEKE